MDNLTAYLTKSQESLAGANSELLAKRFNNAVNRAYYAAFQAAIAALLNANVPVYDEAKKTVMSHQAIQNQFAGLLIVRRKLYPARLARVLYELLSERIVADYQPIQLSQKKAKRLCEKAIDFVDTIAKEVNHDNITTHR
jgi:uncharacterized protein (UPF0332 family)